MEIDVDRLQREFQARCTTSSVIADLGQSAALMQSLEHIYVDNRSTMYAPTEAALVSHRAELKCLILPQPSSPTPELQGVLRSQEAFTRALHTGFFATSPQEAALTLSTCITFMTMCIHASRGDIEKSVSAKCYDVVWQDVGVLERDQILEIISKSQSVEIPEHIVAGPV